MNHMNLHKIFAYLCLPLALLSMASMRKTEDPVAATAQTSPISLQQKIEETKDGVKGAPSPSMTFYGNQKILTSSPLKEDKGDNTVMDESKPAEEAVGKAGNDDDSWEADNDISPKKDQESAKKAVEEGDSWWSEDDSEKPPSDTQSKSEF